MNKFINIVCCLQRLASSSAMRNVKPQEYNTIVGMQ